MKSSPTSVPKLLSLIRYCFFALKNSHVFTNLIKVQINKDATNVWFNHVYINSNGIWYCAEFYFRSK